MPRCPDNIRRSRCVIVRNTRSELETTTLLTWLRWFESLGTVRRLKSPALRYWYTFNDGEGTVELELLFLALDREDDLRKVRSLETTMVYLNELAEIPEAALEHFKGRVGRYPDKGLFEKPFNGCIIADTNPPPVSGWIYNKFEDSTLDSYQIFKQPPGLIKDEDGKWIFNPDAENIERLGTSYYTQMSEGATEEFIKVFCLGEYGTYFHGKVVYPEYNDDIHAVDNIIPNPDDYLYIGFDFGLTPSCIICQVAQDASIKVLNELLSSHMGLEQFMEDIVMPFVNQHYKDYTIAEIVGDPSGIAGSQTRNETCFEILDSFGFTAKTAMTNDLAKRLGVVKFYFNRLIGGKPAITISKQGCPFLREGLLGGYNFKKLKIVGSDECAEKPDKNKYSHIQDALQYVLMQINDLYREHSNPLDIKEIGRAHV